jgi:hypothetical protein
MFATLRLVLSDLADFVKNGFQVRRERTTRSLLPQFQVMQSYEAWDNETLKLRLVLSSYHTGDRLQQPLSGREFVFYSWITAGAPRLLFEGMTSSAPLHVALKGKPGVHIGIEPKPQSIMELCAGDATKALLFVTHVGINHHIEAESIGLYQRGEFRYDVFTKPEWQAWRPVFISYTTPL